MALTSSDEGFDEHGYDITYTREDAKSKAESTHSTMGLVSALLAGFELQALVEVDMCVLPEECTGMEGAFVLSACACVCLSTVVVFETSFEYAATMRELHHGNQSAWKLIKRFAPYRRIAEYCFALDLAMFILSTAMMVHVRFASLTGSHAVATTAHVFLSLTAALIFVMIAFMQRVKVTHGQGAKKMREKARQEKERRKLAAERASMLAGGSTKGSSMKSGKKRVTGWRKMGGSSPWLLAGGRSSQSDAHMSALEALGGHGKPRSAKCGNVSFASEVGVGAPLGGVEEASARSEEVSGRDDDRASSSGVERGTEESRSRTDSATTKMLAVHDSSQHSLDNLFGSMRDESMRDESDSDIPTSPGSGSASPDIHAKA